MKIIQCGTQKNITHQTQCRNCNSVLEFQENEAKIINDRNELCMVVNCPICQNDIYIAKK